MSTVKEKNPPYEGSITEDYYARGLNRIADALDMGEQLRKKNRAAIALGKLGGKSKSAAKAAASRKNGKLGGRPRKAQQPQEKTDRG